jgi:hypothetical protein
LFHLFFVSSRCHHLFGCRWYFSEVHYFCYLAPGEQVLLAPGNDSNDDMEAVNEDEEEEEEEEDTTMDEEAGAEEEDGESEIDDTQMGMPSSK